MRIQHYCEFFFTLSFLLQLRLESELKRLEQASRDKQACLNRLQKDLDRAVAMFEECNDQKSNLSVVIQRKTAENENLKRQQGAVKPQLEALQTENSRLLDRLHEAEAIMTTARAQLETETQAMQAAVAKTLDFSKVEISMHSLKIEKAKRRIARRNAVIKDMDNILRALECRLCMQWMSDPMLSVPCGHLLCQSCIHEGDCAVCQQPVQQRVRVYGFGDTEPKCEEDSDREDL
jgi:DNA repair exonuclease SbcCD ATPase subunit